MAIVRQRLSGSVFWGCTGLSLRSRLPPWCVGLAVTFGLSFLGPSLSLARPQVQRLVDGPQLAQAGAAENPTLADAKFYDGLAKQSEARAKLARETAAGERKNADQFRENAEGWRDNAADAKKTAKKFRDQGDEKSAKEFDDLAKDAEKSAQHSEQQAEEADVAARRAEHRAKVAEREAKAFKNKAGTAEKEAREEGKPGHQAVLTDSKTVFHRLYIMGDPDNDSQRTAWLKDMEHMKGCLEGDGRQAKGSTSRTLMPDKNSPTDVRKALEAMQKLAKPGEEITFYYSGHGGGGPLYGGKDYQHEKNDAYDEHLNGNIVDDQIAEWMAGFSEGVSKTLLLDSCFGGGMTGGSSDIKENKLVRVIGVGTTCPSDGTTLTSDSCDGLDGAADYDKDGVVTALELTYYLKAEGWDVRAPYDNNKDISWREQLAVWRDDFLKWAGHSRVKPAETEETVEIAQDSQKLCQFGDATALPYPLTPLNGSPNSTTVASTSPQTASDATSQAGASGSSAPATTESPRPLAPAQIKEIQTRLTGLGFNPGPADGQMGPATRAAIKDYQRGAQLTPDGVASPALLDRLRGTPSGSDQGQPSSYPQPSDQPDQTTTKKPDEPSKKSDPASVPKVTIFIKASKTVLSGSGQEKVQNVANQQIKLFAPATTNVALPAPGGEKDQSDHDEDPIQGVTGSDGVLKLTASPVALGLSPSNGTAQTYEIDLVSSGAQSSKTAKLDTQDAAVATARLPDALRPFLQGSPQILNDVAFVTLLYPADQEQTVSALIAAISGLLGVQVNVCRIKEPVATLDWQNTGKMTPADIPSHAVSLSATTPP